MADDSGRQPLRIFGVIALFTLIGTPLVAVLWETLNRVMAGWFDPFRIILSIPTLILLYLLLRYFGRVAERVA
jgi:hypothetical protein